jgi:two-component system response regulator AtoC
VRPSGASDDDSTEVHGGADGGALCLMAIANGVVTSHVLPAGGGSLVIGRAEQCDVRIDDRSISRRHAVLHVGPPLRIEDLGSANGTSIRGRDAPDDRADGAAGGRRLRSGEIAELAPGDFVALGQALVTIWRGALPGDRAASDPAGRESDGGARSDAMVRLEALATRVAGGDISVLLLGETGVGKEVMAEAIHARSKRAEGPFLRLNCASLGETLLESELFGHEKGSFTGAVAAKPGLLETADGGTVFLDEVGEMPLATQAKLLRVIEDRQVLRVGGLRPRAIDVRFVAATHRDLADAVRRGAFREDLYFRLNGISLRVPPLRERVGEIDGLARRFVARAWERTRSAAPPPVLADEALAALRRHAWPGNVRELRNAIERAVLLCNDGEIRAAHLLLDDDDGAEAPAETARGGTSSRPPAPALGASASASASAGESPALRREVDAFERARIVDALERCGGNQTQAARVLGISRRTLVARLGEYGIRRGRR